MSNQFLKLRRSSVPGKIPTTSSLEFGEIALNTYDGLAFMKKSGSAGEEIVTIGSTSGSFTGSLYGTASWALNVVNGTFPDILNTVTVGLSGSTGVDYNSIKTALDTITDASANKPYAVIVSPGVYIEDTMNVPQYVIVKGDSSTTTIVSASNPNNRVFNMSDQSMLIDMQVQGSTGTGVSAIYYSSSTTPQTFAISYVENVRFGTNYTNATCEGLNGANIIMQCSNVKYGGYTSGSKSFDVGFVVTGSNSGIGRMQLRNVTSTNGGITGSADQVFAMANGPGCTFIVNGCLLTKSVGAARGTGFLAYNGASLRLTAVNFQRWEKAIYLPNTGSATSIFGSALNFENDTYDLLVEHPSASGKVDGLDTFLKSVIPVNAPLYEVNQDPKRITVAKKGGDFSSISASVAWITDSADTNRYVIEVGPGKFVENEIDLRGRPYVSIVGSNIQTTEIFPSSSNQHIIRMGISNEISFLTLTGAGSGYAAIYVDDIGDFAQAHKVSINDSDTGIRVNSSTLETQFYGEYIDINGAYTYGLYVSSSNSVYAFANMENYYQFPVGSPIKGNYAIGPYSLMSIKAALFQNDGTINATAFQLEDGAQIEITSLDIQGFDPAYYIPDVGAGPVIRATGVMVHDSLAYDFYNENISTQMRYTGLIDGAKIVNNSPTVYWNRLDDITGQSFMNSIQSTSVTASFLGDLIGTASWALNSLTASFVQQAVSASYATTASYALSVSGTVQNAVSAAYAGTASWAINALTASSADNFIIRGSVTGSDALFTGTITAQKLNVQYITASTEFITGSTKFGTQLTDTHQFTGSVSITGSLTVNGPLNATSSWAVNALTSSYVLNAVSSSFATTASYVALAQTASYVQNAQTASYVQQAQTASYVTLAQSASYVLQAVSSSFATTASYVQLAQTASFVTTAQTASYVQNAQTASYVQQAQTASYVLNAVSSSFASTASFVTTAQTASFVATSSWAQNAITASYVTASNIYGPFGSNSVVSSSYALTASFALNAGGASAITVADEGTAQGTATFLNFTGAGVTATVASNTASINIPGGAGATFPYTGSAIISGSLIVTGSVSATQGGFTGSLLGTASWAQNSITASYVTTAQTASFVATSSWANNAASSSYPISVIGSTIYSTNPLAGPDLKSVNSIFLGEGSGYGTEFGLQGGEYSNFIGYQAGYSATDAAYSNFIGNSAGYSASNAFNSNFIGDSAGYISTDAHNSNFIGPGAGVRATFANYSNFFGQQAGSYAINASYSNFLGQEAGYSASAATKSNFFGRQSGVFATNAEYANFIGEQAGYAAAEAYYSSFIGASAGKNATNAWSSQFIGADAGLYATDANQSVFLGEGVGSQAAHSNRSTFIGSYSGFRAVSASNSILIGYKVGSTQDVSTTIGNNNIVLGSYITLPAGNQNGINIGGILFGSGSYFALPPSPSTYQPFSGSANGRIGINQPDPQFSLDVSGSGRYTNGLQVTGSLKAPSITGSLFGTASWAENAVTASFVTLAQSASYVQNAQTASYVLQAVSASFATTASYVRLAESASYVLQAVSASFATTSSYAVTASYALQALSSSYSQTASYGVNIVISGSINNADYIQFNTASSVTDAVGRLYFDGGEGTLRLGLNGSNVIASIGEDLYQYAYNATGAPLTKGQVVYISGSQGNRIAVKLASATAEQGSANTLGLVAEAIGTGGEGWIQTEGVLRRLNTIGLVAGQLLFLSTTPGAYTQTPPVAPNHGVRLGYPERIDATVGSIYIKIDNGYEIGELHDVVDSTTTSSFGDLLIKSGSVWINSKQLTGSYGLTGSLTAVGSLNLTGSLSISGSTVQVGNNTLLGNTLLSGSITISGSATPGSPTASVQIYGDIRQSGYHRFDPVTTNINTSISASYIYVSGSTNDLYFSQNGAGYNNVTRLRWLEGNLYTGLLHGGIITATLGTNTYKIGSGSGVIVDLNVSFSTDPYPVVQFLQWQDLTGTIDALSGSYDQSFVAVLSNGTIGAQGTPYNNGDYNTKIPIGIVIHQNRSTINAFQTFPGVAYGWKQRSFDFIKAFGPLKISGYTLAPSGSSTGSLVLSGGTAWVDGRNYTVDPNEPSYIQEGTGIVTSKIFRYRQSGSDFVYDTNAGNGYATIDPANYSNNGVLTAVPVTNWTIQRVFYFPNSATKAFYVYYGNAAYSNDTEALAAVGTEQFTEAPNTAANAIYVGYMLLRNNADFTNASTFEFYQSGLFRNSGGGGGGGGGGGATALTQLTDVSITSPTDYQPFVYNSVTTKWENRSAISASLVGNASTATTASYALTASLLLGFVSTASYAFTASYVVQAQTASYVQLAESASYVLNSVSASYAATASSADSFLVRQSITASSALITGTITAQTLNVQYITASTEFVTGSSKFGSLSTDTHQFTGSVSVSGSFSVTGRATINDLTGSLFGTASWSTAPIAVIGSSTEATLYSVFPSSTSTILNNNTPWRTGSIFLGYNAGLSAFNSDYAVILGFQAGANSISQSHAIMIGRDAGNGARLASHSIFIGRSAGTFAVSASYSTHIGYNTGRPNNQTNTTNRNNIIIGTNIGLPPGTVDSVNLGGIIFATGSYFDTVSVGCFTGSVGNGRVGINVVSPNYNLDVSGSGNYTNGLTVTGSVTSTGGFTGSLFGTASWANNAVTASFVTLAQTASYVQQAQSASYVLNAVSSSFASTASFVTLAQTASFVTLAQTASFVTLAQSASYVLQAQSASFATNAATASFVQLAQSASYVQLAQSASYVLQAVSSSFASTASFVALAQTASFVTLAQTASFVTLAQTASFVTLAQTASFVTTAQTASYVTGSVFTSANPALSASYALTASFALNGGGGSVQQFFYTSSQAPNSASLETLFVSQGTMNLVSQSASVTGSGTAFIGDSGTNTLEYWYECFVYDATNSKWWFLVFNTIDSDTLATLYSVQDLENVYASGSYFQQYTEFPGTTGNYQWYIGKSFSNGYQASSISAYGSTAGGIFSFVRGFINRVTGNYSEAQGRNNLVMTLYSHAEGSFNIVNAFGSHAEGGNNLVDEFSSLAHAEGRYTTASGLAAHSEGYGSQAGGEGAHAEGYYTFTGNNYCHAEGYRTYAAAIGSHAEGAYTFTGADGAHAEGAYTTASANYAHSEGSGSTASGVGSHAEGFSTTALGVGSHAEGFSTTALGIFSHAEGKNTSAIGEHSHAEGNQTNAGVSFFSITSVSSGVVTILNNGQDLTQWFPGGTAIFADGTTYSLQSYSNPVFSGGNFTIDLSDTSINSGLYIADSTKTNAPISVTSLSNPQVAVHAHAEGFGTFAFNDSSHAEGLYTIAQGNRSHAEGAYTVSNGVSSHAEGFYTIAQGDYQHVQGQYNQTSSVQSAFIIGNGADENNRSNLVFAAGTEFQVTGSVISTGGFTGSLAGTASWAQNAVTASYVTGSVFTSANPALSASYALTASFALNGGGGAAFPYTGSAVISGSLQVTGSVSSTGGFTGSLFGTSSWSNNAVTASYVTGSIFVGSNRATSASYAISASNALSASYVQVFPFTGSARITGSLGITGSLSVLGSGSNLFTISGSTGPLLTVSDNNPSDNNIFVLSTGSIDVITVSNSKIVSISGSLIVTGSITGSLFGTASYVTGSIYTAGNLALSASFAVSASWAPGGGLKTKAGSIANTTFAGNPKKATVTFSTAFADANYAVTVTGEDARSWTIESKVAGSFIINANANTALAGTTYWIATAYGET